MTQRGRYAMGKTPLNGERARTIVPLQTAQDEASATTLARYWDARLQGRVLADTDLDPEVRDMVQLLEHYRGVTPPVTLAPDSSPPWRPAIYAVLLMLAVVLLFTSNTLLSPRSWLLSTATDPDWIPWLSDDWLSPRFPAAGSILSQLATPLRIVEEFPHGA